MLRDHTPTLPIFHELRPEWRIKADEREAALSKRNAKMVESYDRGTKMLPELNVNDHVAVQNQHGTNPRRWSKTGEIVERHDSRQYTVRMDGSSCVGCVTLRNRKFLKKIQPVCADPPLPRVNESWDVPKIGNATSPIVQSPAVTPPRPSPEPVLVTPPTALRRSTRNRETRKLLCVDPSKKSYDVSTVSINQRRK